MAIYYINVQIIGRSAGRTATGAAAYRAGERIHDDRTGQSFDYTRRRGEIETEIMAPANSPAWVHDRERLWNAVEMAEKRGDAQVAREIVVALPKELSNDQQRQLIRGYVQEQFVSRGMVADVAIHRNPGNPHAHIMLTLREMTEEGLATKKNREWNKPEALERWRSEWANHANRVLERVGLEERIDHRSLAEQGLGRMPQIHLGPHAAALERHGVPTDKGDHNRVATEHNAVVVDLERARAEKKALEIEKAVEDRMKARLQEGWAPSHAQAMSQVELTAGGRTFTSQELSTEYSRLWQSHRSMIAEIQHIENDGRRLTRATWAAEHHAKATAALKRHQGPIGTVRRVFSPQAREDYQKAQGNVKEWERTMNQEGVTSRNHLEQQRTAWKAKEARLPNMRTQADRMVDRMNTITLAIRGLDHALERIQRALTRQRVPERQREDEWELQRSRGREQDRGR